MGKKYIPIIVGTSNNKVFIDNIRNAYRRPKTRNPAIPPYHSEEVKLMNTETDTDSPPSNETSASCIWASSLAWSPNSILLTYGEWGGCMPETIFEFVKGRQLLHFEGASCLLRNYLLIGNRSGLGAERGSCLGDASIKLNESRLSI